jgi:hypothetical protein
MTSDLSPPPPSGQPTQCGSAIIEHPDQTTPEPSARPKEHGDTLAPLGSSSSDRILFLDDDPDRALDFLARHPEAVWVQTAGECIARLAEAWDQVHLDHDLGGEVFVDSSRTDCGMEVVRWLCADPHKPHGPTWFIVHTHNPEAAVLMVGSLRQLGYNAVYRPFGIDPTDWFAPEPIEEPCPQQQPVPVRLALTLRGWLDRRLTRIRRAAQRRSNAENSGPPDKETSVESSNFGSEGTGDR